MAGYRQFHTKFWKDEWTIDLEPLERYLFTYLFTNDLSSISGIYRIPLRVIANETGLTNEFVQQCLENFEKQEKVFYRDNTMWVVNMEKYHNNASPKTQTKVQKDIETIPDNIVKHAYQCHKDTGIFCIDVVSIQYAYQTIKAKAKAQTESQAESQAEAKGKQSPPPSDDSDLDGVSYRELEIAFREKTGIYPPTGGGIPTHKWVDGFKKLTEQHATPEEIAGTIDDMRERGLSISGPSSILNPLNIYRAKHGNDSSPHGEIRTEQIKVLWPDGETEIREVQTRGK